MAIRSGFVQTQVSSSVFFRNVVGIWDPSDKDVSIDVAYCLFMENKIGVTMRPIRGYGQLGSLRLLDSSIFAYNGQAAELGLAYQVGQFQCTDLLFYGNDIAMGTSGIFRPLLSGFEGLLRNITFKDNRVGLKIGPQVFSLHLDKVNFMGSTEYNIHWLVTPMYSSWGGWLLDGTTVSWNATSSHEVFDKIFDAENTSDSSIVHISPLLLQAPFHHGMYQEGDCAGQCTVEWFNAEWVGLMDVDSLQSGLELKSGQGLRDALLNGYSPSNLSLAAFLEDQAAMLSALGGTLPGSPFSNTSTTSTTSTAPAPTPAPSTHITSTSLPAPLVVVEPVWIRANTTWSSNEVRTLASPVHILPGVTLTVEGEDSFAALTLDADTLSLSFSLFLQGFAAVLM